MQVPAKIRCHPPNRNVFAGSRLGSKPRSKAHTGSLDTEGLMIPPEPRSTKSSNARETAVQGTKATYPSAMKA
jgi:hypothetical protein